MKDEGFLEKILEDEPEYSSYINMLMKARTNIQQQEIR